MGKIGRHMDCEDGERCELRFVDGDGGAGGLPIEI